MTDLDTATIVGSAITGLLTGGGLTAAAGAIVLVMKNRREGKIEELKAETDVKAKTRADALEEWSEIHKRDEAEIERLNTKVDTLQKRVDEFAAREAACEARCARLEEQVKQLTLLVQQYQQQLLANKQGS